jgi:dihydropteroate synthase-like protein
MKFRRTGFECLRMVPAFGGVEAMPRYLFVTGKLAAQSLGDTLKKMPCNFEYEIAVLPISVAALMDAAFIAKNLPDAGGFDKILIPGSCKLDLSAIAATFGREVERGPNNLKDLPAFFGSAPRLTGYGAHRTKIFAEIVDAYQLSPDELLARANYYKASGADIIDLGCPVTGGFADIEKAVRFLKEHGFRVSVDSFNTEDILKADRAGVDYVLSVNSKNLELARRLRCKVVVIPDPDQGMESLERSIAQLKNWNIPHIIDPVLSPIAFGFTESIENFIITRRRHPDAEMLIGLGNLTELTDADSTGITAVMAGIATELKIDYALTTEVISWTRGAVRELDIARQLMHHACENKLLPKHLNDALITVKDPPFEVYGEDELRSMRAKVRDRNFRIFADRESIYVFNKNLFVKGTDTQAIFDQLNIQDAREAFYIGRELQKARLAVQLGKRYVQEENLRWGYLSS